MSTTNRRPVASAATLAPQPSSFADSEAYQEIVAQRAILLQKQEENQARITLHIINGQLDNTLTKSQRDRLLARKRELHRRLKELGATPVATGAGAIAVALKLASGEDVETALAPADRLAQLRRHETIIEQALAQLANKLAEARDVESDRVYRELVPSRVAMLRKMFDGLSQAAAAVDEMSEQNAALARDGYTPRPDLLSGPGSPIFTAIGSLRNPHSAITAERKRLEALGVLPATRE